MIQALNNIGDMLHNVFDAILSFFENVGNTFIDLWNYVKLLPEYVSSVTRLMFSFLPPSVWFVFSAILALAIIKIATGRDS